MRIEYLATIALAAAGAELGSVPTERESTPAAARLSHLLAESADPFLNGSGG